MPGQEAKLNLVLLEEVNIVGGAFAYLLPASFFPDYKKHSVRSDIDEFNSFAVNYAFSYEV